MSQLIKPQKPTLELADILREHIRDYQKAYPMSPEQYRIVFNLLNCRTAKLGGHLDRCDHCGAERILYHSCRNRHCPKCQQIPRERWLEKRKAELLPVPYFHVVFTLPHELNPINLKNKSLMLNILFKAVSQTLIKFGEKELGGKPGFVALLHTWDQKLKAHFHLHCLVSGGAVSSKSKRWIPCKDNYLFNQEALSLVFRGKFIHYLTGAIRRGKLNFGEGYQQFKNRLYKHTWVVSVRELYVFRPFGTHCRRNQVTGSASFPRLMALRFAKVCCLSLRLISSIPSLLPEYTLSGVTLPRAS